MKGLNRPNFQQVACNGNVFFFFLLFPFHPFFLHKKLTSIQGRHMLHYILTVDTRPENVLILSFSLHQQNFNINVWPSTVGEFV